MKSLGLKTKLIVGGGIISILPLIIVGLFSLSKSSSALLDSAEVQVRTTARNLATMVDLYMNEEVELAKTIATNPLMQKMLHKAEKEGIEKISEETASLDSYLKEIHKKVGENYENFFVADSKGLILSDSEGGINRRLKVSVADRKYMQSAKSSGNVIISEPVKSKSTSEPIVVITIPLKNSMGDFIGIFCSVIKFKSLSDIVVNIKIGKTGYPFIADKTGLVIAHPDKDSIFKLDMKKEASLKKIGKKVLAQQPGIDEYTYKGDIKIAGFYPVKSTGWSLVTTQNQSDFLKPVIYIRNVVLLVGSIFLILTILGVLYLARDVMGQLGNDPSEIAKVARRIAEGDLTYHFDSKGKSIVGVYSDMKIMTDNLKSMFKDISYGVKTIRNSSTELSAVSNKMAAGAEQSSEKAEKVTHSAEELSTVMGGVSAATEQTNSNLQMIVSSAEEMAATIDEIAENTSKGSRTTSDAVEKAEIIYRKVEILDSVTSEINKVTETIAEISEQTNLLALNATIEAARAGVSGRGFAVVAEEIKSLAKETAKATEKIGHKIGEVQLTTRESVDAIKSIVQIIDEINSIVTSVAAAISQQSVTTQDITSNVTQAAAGVKEVSDSINQTSVISGVVSEDIHKVSQSADEVTAGSIQINDSALELSKLAENLSDMIGKFKL